MNTIQLECFVAVAEQLNFAKAAEQVHMSQPAVTKKIQSLEEELEVQLFERDTRHVILTSAGKQFYSNAKSILLQEQNAMALLAQLKAEQKRSLNIGCHNLDIYTYLGQVLERVYARTQDIRPDIIDAPFQSLNLSMIANSIDIVIGTYEVMELAGMQDCAFHALCGSPFYCLTAPKNQEIGIHSFAMKDLTPGNLQERLGVRQRISCADLERYYNSKSEWSQMLQSFRNDTLICDNMEAAHCMVQAGIGVMFMAEPDIMWSRKQHYIPISDVKPMNYGYFYNVSNHNPLLKIFRQELENYFDEYR